MPCRRCTIFSSLSILAGRLWLRWTRRLVLMCGPWCGLLARGAVRLSRSSLGKTGSDGVSLDEVVCDVSGGYSVKLDLFSDRVPFQILQKTGGR
ncbi:uncharacterized protein BKA55DRAFT_569195 [Fusarium redolens]|uniref:Uncharacterized protein n=1 Tax=Fusarium redolens TaxID=48865 RepID=A0A9P9KEU1_FUSRE|nr:uncharacterized protein BKA55DRAFT_569195 [Fusarium redolens]KAH7250304.1 hypothetical protein BKA55DRAFT_569195 [Fusarium redolens]